MNLKFDADGSYPGPRVLCFPPLSIPTSMTIILLVAIAFMVGKMSAGIQAEQAAPQSVPEAFVAGEAITSTPTPVIGATPIASATVEAGPTLVMELIEPTAAPGKSTPVASSTAKPPLPDIPRLIREAAATKTAAPPAAGDLP